MACNTHRTRSRSNAIHVYLKHIAQLEPSEANDLVHIAPSFSKAHAYILYSIVVVLVSRNPRAAYVQKHLPGFSCNEVLELEELH